MFSRTPCHWTSQNPQNSDDSFLFAVDVLAQGPQNTPRRAHVDHSKEGFGVPRHKSCRLLRLLQPRVLAPVSLVVTLLHLGRARAPPHDQESLHSHYAPSWTNGIRHAMVVLWICSSTLSRNLSLKGWILKPSYQYLIVIYIYLVNANVQNEHWAPKLPLSWNQRTSFRHCFQTQISWISQPGPWPLHIFHTEFPRSRCLFQGSWWTLG